MAAKAATSKVTTLARKDHEELVPLLETMHEEAAKTEERCGEVAGSFDGKKTAILDEARTTRDKASRMLEIYLDDDSDALDGFEFLTMAEAGEVGHWEVLEQMARKAGNDQVVDLVGWSLPIQKRHLADARETAAKLAASESPDEEA
jgi:hypothetical protein